MKKRPKRDEEKLLIRLIIEPEGFWPFVLFFLRFALIGLLVIIATWICAIVLFAMLARWCS